MHRPDRLAFEEEAFEAHPKQLLFFPTRSAVELKLNKVQENGYKKKILLDRKSQSIFR